MNLEPDDERYLLDRIRAGEAMLVLGAGASVSSRNSRSDPIKAGKSLSETLASKAGLPYHGETLVEVLSATRGDALSDLAIREVYTNEFKGCQPSPELETLFTYSWRRIYTWNIDDTIENVNRRFLQTRRFYNGMIDKAVEFEGYNVVHIVHLHGEITKPEHGFIFTDKEYSTVLKSDRHFWYQRAAQDYLATSPIFIGSSISESIFSAELERAKREGDLVAGRAYSVTPDELTVIQQKGLRARGIVHIKATLEEFAKWLRKKIPGGWSPQEVVSERNKYSIGAIRDITSDEISAAHSLKPIKLSNLKAEFARFRETERDGFARYFLQGYPPTWEIVASEVPVRLEGYRSLYSSFKRAVSINEKLFVVTGQAGSGKTTGAMSTVLQFCEENNLQLYQLSPDVKSVRRAISLLKKIRSGKIVLYVGDLFIYGDSFGSDMDFYTGDEIIIVTTARTGEWRDHFTRYLGEKAVTYQFQRFVRSDFDPLIDRLIRYVPAPTFRALTREKQYLRLADSQNQLLIALREATGSENFDEVISQEFQSLPDRDTKRLFVTAGLATLARVGISVGAAREAYETSTEQRSFDRALDALGGIVAESADGRLLARHDIYVRHLFDKVVHFDEIRICIKAILKTYRKYNIPIIRSVSRRDSLLFKALINHNFVFLHAKRLRVPLDAADIYEEFEVDFQLDGHFWLQYGLFLASAGETNGAMEKLTRSIEAYPENAFAVHALADIQLRAAKKAKTFDQRTRDLIDTAVRTLNAQDAQSGLEIDVYPIVTLANGHIGALVAHDQLANAREAASAYFERIQFLQRRVSAGTLQQTRDKLLKLITLGEWADRPVSMDRQRAHSAPKKRRGNKTGQRR